MKTKIILEMCANHNGSLAIAKAMIDEAARLKVFGVKFQKRDIENMSEIGPYIPDSDMFGNTWKEHCEFLEFSISEMVELKEHAENRGLEFSCTAFDEQSIKDLISIDVDHIKLPSQLYLDKYCYLELSGNKNVYVTVSTGMHTWEEIINGQWFYEADMVYYCISKYPASVGELNLNTFKDLCVFRKKMGYSSHESEGLGIPSIILLGAERIERHYTLDKNMKGPDHLISSDYREMKNIIESITVSEQLLGNHERELDEIERKSAEVFRCS
jgi:sialic acid synthase SpsE